MRELEGEIAKLKENDTAQKAKIQELEASHEVGLSTATARNPLPNPVARPSSTSISRSSGRSLDEPLSREVGRMNLDRHETGRFMGSSSGIFFIGTAQKKLASASNSPDRIGDELLRVDTDDLTTEYQIHPVNVSAEPLELPPRAIVDKTINNWFNFWKYTLPVLHPPSFITNVDALYSSNSQLFDRVFLAQFYLVLALGSRHRFLTGETNEGLPTLITTNEEMHYFQESMKYYNNVLDVNNLHTLQFQELLTLWFLYTGKRSLAFQMTGSMAKLALELGLHRHSRRFNFSPLITELRKRAFWVCYILDM